MAILCYDYTMLAEPNLLIPGVKPVNTVTVSNSHWMKSASGIWLLRRTNDVNNLVTGVSDGTKATTVNISPIDGNMALSCDGTNGGFQFQTLNDSGNYFTAPHDFTLIALCRPTDFTPTASYHDGSAIGTTYGSFRYVNLGFNQSGIGRARIRIDATGTDATAVSDRDDTEANWGWGILAGGSKGNIPWVYFKSLPGQGNKAEYNTTAAWSGDVGGETVSIGYSPRTSGASTDGIDIAWAAIIERSISVSMLDALALDPYEFLSAV